MAKRFTDTEKYKKGFIRILPAAYKIFWDYLYHDCSFAGIWQVDFEVAQIRVGKDAPITPQEALRLFNTGEIRIIVLNNGSKWLIKPFIDFQYGELNPNNRVHKSVLEELAKQGIKGLASPLQRAKDKDKEKDKDKDKDKDIVYTTFLDTLKTNIAYNHINIEIELGKMDAWLSLHPGRQKTKQFVLKWLNKIEKPLPTQQPHKLIDTTARDLAKRKKIEEEAALVDPAEVRKLLEGVKNKIGGGK
jgi:hypothetical protein